MDFREIGSGLAIHFENGVNVMALSDCSSDGYFVATDGKTIQRMRLTAGCVPCDNEELDAVFHAMNENGFTYCYECMELEPCKTIEESKKDEAQFSELTQVVDKFFDDINKILKR